MRVFSRETKSQTNANQGFIRRVNILFLSSFFVVALLVFLLVYQPMKSELEKSLVENFRQVSLTKYHSFQTTLQRATEGQKSLSSRTMIKNAILDYRDGKTNLEELQLYTQPKYEDGARVLENLIFAERLVDGIVVGKYSNPRLVTGVKIPQEKLEDELVLNNDILITQLQNRMIGIIKSPIMEGSEILGYDVLYYDFTEPLQILSTEFISVEILDSETYKDLLINSESVEKHEDWTMTIKADSIFMAAPIGKENNFILEEKIPILFQPIKRLAIQIAIGVSVTFIIYALAVYFFLVRFTKEELINLENSKNRFEEIAYRDKLTGAFSRHFLDIWNQSIRSNHPYEIVMMDIDDFKKINDTQGHLAGDQVLKNVGEVLSQSIHEKDYLFRYGGDEFLLILADAETERTHQLMERIQTKLKHQLADPIPIHLSYGIEMLDEGHPLEDKLMEADRKMYENKYRNQKN